MKADLSIFADRLREFITICSDEPESFSVVPGTPLARHYDAEFNAMALVLFALQFTHNKPYRRICESRNVQPGSIAHWTEVPAVPTGAFKDLELTCIAPGDRTSVFHSSGTTQQRPSRHFHCPESLALYEHALWPWFRIHVLSPDPGAGGATSSRAARGLDLQPIVLTPPPGQAPHSSLVHMFNVVRAQMGAPDSVFVSKVDAEGAWVLDAPAALDRLRASTHLNAPILLLGTAFSLVHLFDHMIANDVFITLPRGSRLMETGGYKGRVRELSQTELRTLIATRLGIAHENILAEYGMSELSSQAYQFGALEAPSTGAPFRFPPWARVQIVSPETGLEAEPGQPGLIRVFDLANVFSVMAVQTEDLGIRHHTAFQLIGRPARVEARGCSLMSQTDP